MSDGYEEDLAMYEEASGRQSKQLDNQALLRPISDLDYPESPLSVSTDTTVGDALDLMAELRIGAAIVQENGKLVGIFAERDALMKGLYHGGHGDKPISDYMTPNPDCLTPDDSIALALNRMVQGGYRHVPLIAPDRTPVGILVMRDVVAHIVSHFAEEIINVPPHSEHNPPDRARAGG
ncbi:MAG: CBS domain-containing protein [bacterium]|nr:CBS domain-containing protein [bacterium]